jgi:hypothetical protein
MASRMGTVRERPSGLGSGPLLLLTLVAVPWYVMQTCVRVGSAAESGMGTGCSYSRLGWPVHGHASGGVELTLDLAGISHCRMEREAYVVHWQVCSV